MNGNRIIFIMLIFLFFFSYLLSNTIIVDINGSGDYVAIQQGINASLEGDTVLVYSGAFYENINFNGKNIIVASKYYTTGEESYIDSTIIDGNQNGSVVTFENGEDTTAVLCGFTIQHGSGMPYGSSSRGGGIICYESHPVVKNCIITENQAGSGGGICCKSSTIGLSSVTINNNHAQYNGGGIYFWDNSNAIFDVNERCNIFHNYSSNGSDIQSLNCNDINIIVDTFTVLEPSNYFAYPVDSFTFNILNYKIDPINQDLYVSPNGCNSNSGTSPSEPLKNISYALIKITSDSTHPNTIHLASGEYSSSNNDAIFPLNCRSYVSIIGENEENTILDGEESSNLITCVWYDQNFSIENLTLINGYSRIGGAIYIGYNSNPMIKNVTLESYQAEIASSIYCSDDCDPIFENVKVQGDTSKFLNDQPIYISNNSNPVFINCIIKDNIIDPEGTGAGAIGCLGHSNPTFINTKIANNNDSQTSGIHFYNGSQDDTPILLNCTICDNSDCSYGTIRLLAHANLILINCILRNFSDDEIFFSLSGDPDTVTVSYTNIEDSINGINTNNNGTLNWGEGNIDHDPLFVGGDPFSYQLSEDSPCIDAGTSDTTGLNLPATDLAGNPRIYNGRVDIGAYEYIPEAVGGDPDTNFVNKLYLFQNQPNPFSNSTEILFITSDYERVENYTLSIYNTKGQLVRRYEGRANNFSFKTKVIWDGKDSHGREVAPGNYFYKLEYNNNAVVRKMVKLK